MAGRASAQTVSLVMGVMNRSERSGRVFETWNEGLRPAFMVTEGLGWLDALGL